LKKEKNDEYLREEEKELNKICLKDDDELRINIKKLDGNLLFKKFKKSEDLKKINYIKIKEKDRVLKINLENGKLPKMEERKNEKEKEVELDNVSLSTRFESKLNQEVKNGVDEEIKEIKEEQEDFFGGLDYDDDELNKNDEKFDKEEESEKIEEVERSLYSDSDDNCLKNFEEELKYKLYKILRKFKIEYINSNEFFDKYEWVKEQGQYGERIVYKESEKIGLDDIQMKTLIGKIADTHHDLNDHIIHSLLTLYAAITTDFRRKKLEKGQDDEVMTYFNDLISKIKNNLKDKINKNYDFTYLCINVHEVIKERDQLKKFVKGELKEEELDKFDF